MARFQHTSTHGARCLVVIGPVLVCEVVHSQLQDLLWANHTREEQLEDTRGVAGESGNVKATWISRHL